jgi:tRNA/rRNA methyltransferase
MNFLDCIIVILVAPSHPGNVGSVARAMKTMGLGQLRLVNPKYPKITHHAQARALASGAFDVLDQAQTYDDLPTALADVQWAAGMAHKPREMQTQVLDSRATVNYAHQLITQQHAERVAFVFGNERTGLLNDELQHCHVLSMIPTDERYTSLNLAQAVQVYCYEARQVALAELAALTTAANPTQSTSALIKSHLIDSHPVTLATHAQITGMIEHLFEAMRSTGFLQIEHQTKLMPKIQRLFMRLPLEPDEINLLRGFCKSVLAQ